VGDEGIVLTDREREALAGLAEQIGDPWLARQLAGGEPPRPPKKRFEGLSQKLMFQKVMRATTGWVGLLFVAAGAVMAVTMFVHSAVVASLGLLLMGFGAWRIAVERGDDLTRRLKAFAQSRRPPAGGPTSPRTPPAAV
jgi:hypothetical protein